MWSAVCSYVPQLQFAEGIKPHLCIVERKRNSQQTKKDSDKTYKFLYSYNVLSSTSRTSTLYIGMLVKTRVMVKTVDLLRLNGESPKTEIEIIKF